MNRIEKEPKGFILLNHPKLGQHNWKFENYLKNNSHNMTWYAKRLSIAVYLTQKGSTMIVQQLYCWKFQVHIYNTTKVNLYKQKQARQQGE